MYAAPTSNVGGVYRLLLHCVDSILSEAIESHHKEVEKYQTEWREFAKEFIGKLDECETAADPDE